MLRARYPIPDTRYPNRRRASRSTFTPLESVPAALFLEAKALPPGFISRKLRAWQDLTGFTLIELIVVIAIISAVSAATFLMFYGRRNADDLAGAKEQIAAILREAQSRSVSEDKGVLWGVHFANTTTTVFFLFLVFHGLQHGNYGSIL